MCILFQLNYICAAGRYAVIAATGDLHIRIVKSDDSLQKFSCVAVNILNGERRMSDAVYLSVKGELDKNYI